MKKYVPKERLEWNMAHKLEIQNNAKAKNILICGIVLDEYNRISACSNARLIWDTLQIVHEGTSQVNKSMIDNLNDSTNCLGWRRERPFKTCTQKFSHYQWDLLTKRDSFCWQENRRTSECSSKIIGKESRSNNESSWSWYFVYGWTNWESHFVCTQEESTKENRK